MIDYFDPIERKRFIDIADKQIELRVADPYGFWTIGFPKKEKTPPQLQGQYTSYTQAEAAVRNYFNALSQKTIAP